MTSCVKALSLLLEFGVVNYSLYEVGTCFNRIYKDVLLGRKCINLQNGVSFFFMFHLHTFSNANRAS